VGRPCGSTDIEPAPAGESKSSRRRCWIPLRQRLPEVIAYDLKTEDETIHRKDNGLDDQITAFRSAVNEKFKHSWEVCQVS
jgi:hypothetical protein